MKEEDDLSVVSYLLSVCEGELPGLSSTVLLPGARLKGYEDEALEFDIADYDGYPRKQTIGVKTPGCARTNGGGFGRRKKRARVLRGKAEVKGGLSGLRWKLLKVSLIMRPLMGFMRSEIKSNRCKSPLTVVQLTRYARRIGRHRLKWCLASPGKLSPSLTPVGLATKRLP